VAFDQRQREAEVRAAWCARLRPDIAAMARDDVLAQRQADAIAADLGGEKPSKSLSR
jgi:hypothetical protein